MPVTGDQVTALRALLSGEGDEHIRLVAQLDPAVKNGYSMLIAAAFFEAVYRRFGKTGTVGEVVEFVADVRGRSDALARDLDPVVAERLIRAMLGDGSVKDIDDRTKFGAEMALLGGIIGDERLDGAGLEEFLALARETAEEWTK